MFNLPLVRVIDMAREFPHAEIVGMDFVPPAGINNMVDLPPNCRFEVDDANESMVHYEQKFNVVHVRSADPGINDFESFLYEMARTMRPGGVLLLCTAIPVCRPLNDDHCAISDDAFPYSK